MKPILPSLFALVLAACVAPGGSVQMIDGIGLSVRRDDNYYWPAPTIMRSSTGEMVEVEPFPLIPALVVSRTDGVALTEADEDKARRAVNAYCDAASAGAPGQGSRFSDGSWAFNLCT